MDRQPNGTFTQMRTDVVTTLARRALAVTAIIALTHATASAAPCYATLVVRHVVPPPLQSSADTAVFAEAEQLAETYRLYFRVNPIVPDAVHRHAGCVPGTTALLSSEVLFLYSLSAAGRDSLVVRVSLAACTSADVALRGESIRALPARTVDATILGSAVHDAFTSLRRRIDDNPSAAQALGVSM